MKVVKIKISDDVHKWAQKKGSGWLEMTLQEKIMEIKSREDEEIKEKQKTLQNLKNHVARLEKELE